MDVIGCDFHSRLQSIAMLDTETGEVVERALDYESGEARRFYEALKGTVLVGIEATGYTRRFADLLAELEYQLAVGESGKIRAMNPRMQNHDRGDAAHILNLLLRGDFPKIWLPAAGGQGGAGWRCGIECVKDGGRRGG